MVLADNHEINLRNAMTAHNGNSNHPPITGSGGSET